MFVLDQYTYAFKLCIGQVSWSMSLKAARQFTTIVLHALFVCRCQSQVYSGIFDLLVHLGFSSSNS